MRNWLVFSVISTAIIALAISTVIKVYRTDPTSHYLDPDPQLMPGHLLPAGSYCDWQFAMGDSQYCTAQSGADEHVALDVDRKTGIITRTTVSNHGLTIGDLMLIWGEPSGYARGGIALQ